MSQNTKKNKKKNFHAKLGNVNVLLQYNKNILLLLSAVDYRNYSLPKSCVVVVKKFTAPVIKQVYYLSKCQYGLSIT